MAAYGSGAARSIRNGAPVMNVDVGGGTAKIAVCIDGKVTDVTALDVGARLIVLDGDRRIVRLEEAGRRFGAALGLQLQPGAVVTREQSRALAASMADSLFEAMRGGSPRAGGTGLLRLDPLQSPRKDFRREFFRRRFRIHLRRRSEGFRRHRSGTGK